MFIKFGKNVISKILEFFKTAPLNHIFVILSFVSVLAVCIFGLLSYRYQFFQRNDMYGYASDFVSYWDLASSIIAGQGLMYDAGDVPFGLPAVNYPVYLHQRLPVYPIFLAVERYLFDLKLPFTVSYLNLIMVGFNCYLIFLIFKRLFNFKERTAYFVLAVILISFFQILIYANGINSDFFTASLLLYFYYFFTLQSRWRWLSVIFCVLAVFARSSVLVFIGPFLLLSMFQNNRKYLITVVIISLIFLTGLWSYRNYKLSGYFSLTSMNGLGALRVNYLLPNIWHPNSFSRKIKSSDLANKAKIVEIIYLHAGELGGGKDFENFEKDVNKVLDVGDYDKWNILYSDFKKEKFVNQQYYARWNSLSYIQSYFNKLTQEKNVYYAAFRIDDEIKNDVFKFIVDNKIVTIKTLIYRMPALVAYDGFVYNILPYYLSKFSIFNIFVLILLGFIVLAFYVLPILCLFAYSFKVILAKRWRDDNAVLAYSCVAYFFLTLFVLGVTARYLMPIYYFSILYFAFTVNNSLIYLKRICQKFR